MLSDKELKLLDKIQRKTVYEDKFFEKRFELKWFDELRNRGYFNPNLDTIPRETKEKGYFFISQWNVLPYLEKVSQQVGQPGNEKYADELLKIIREVTDYHIKNNRILDNYRTWWYFVKILLNIPNDKIPMDIIELIPIWLDSKFDTTLQGADIANKLLPKFLDSDNPNDLEKAEKIIESITSIKWKELPEEIKKGLFGKEEEPITIIDGYWLIESFIKQKIATKIGEKCSDNIIFIIANRIKEIFRRERPVHWIDVKYKNDIIRITAIHLNDYQFKISFGLIRKEILAQEETNIFNGIRAKPEKEIPFELTKCKDRNTFVATIRENVLSKFRDLDGEIEKQLHHLYSGIFSDLSYIWFRSIFSIPIHISTSIGILATVLRDILAAKSLKNKPATVKIIETFLSNEYQYPLFKRIVLFVIGTEWVDYKNIFWNMLKEDVKCEFFDDSHFEADLFKLLEKNVKQFSLEEKEKIKRVIEKGPQRYLPEDKQAKYIAYWKQKWYSALKSDLDFVPLYEENKKITQIEEEIPGKEPEIRFGPGPSPLSKEKILTMSNEDLAEYLTSFETKDPWKGPTVQALAEVLMQTVKEKPEKFTENLDPFLDIPYLYGYNILGGMKEAWNAKKIIEWGKLFDFTKKYINRQAFWDNQFKIVDDRWNVNYLWVTGMVGELIQDGTRDDSWAFSEKYFDNAKDILFLILEKHKPKKKEEIKDSVSYALNSPSGKLITALIYLALCIARIEDKKGNKQEPKWSKEMRNRYEQVLQDEIIEAYTLLGQYMPNLYYLDKKWVEEKISSVSPVEKPNLWEAFMDGYLFGSKVYENLYKLMKPHYLKAVYYAFKEKSMTERLIQHICIGYLGGNEDFSEKSLFGKLLKKWDPSQIKEIISFFWIQRDYKDEEDIREKIIAFWRWVYQNKYENKKSQDLNEEDKKILSDLSKLTVFFPRINSENNNWLKLSAPYVHLDFNSSFFIEYLNELKNKEDSIKYIGKVFLKILEGSTPDFRQEDILSIIEYLYKSRYKGDANSISDVYIARGYEFLRTIHQRFNPKSE